MSSFREAIGSGHGRDQKGTFADGPASLAITRLEKSAMTVCRDQGMSYGTMSPVQRLFLTHYKCPVCRLVPLDLLDVTHSNKARCGKCGHLVSFNSASKYGKLRKRIAMFMRAEERHVS